MKAFLHRYLGQSLARIFALTIPFAITLAARALFPEAQSIAFFRLLADAVLVTAFTRLGVDVYVARCPVKDGRIVFSRGYMIVFHAFALASMGLFLLRANGPIGSQGGLVETLGIAAVVVEAALLAEIARTRGWFSLFYLLKAPMIYVAVTVWVFARQSHPAATDVVAAAILLATMVTNLRFCHFEQAGPGWARLFPATALSVLIVLFSWKETLFLDRFGDDHALEIATFYTRFKLVITFFFTLHNARVPNLMREAGPDITPDRLRAILRGPRRMIWGWSALSIVAGLLFAWLVDPADILPATLMLASCIVLTAYGNLVPVLNAMDRQSVLIVAHTQGLVVFVCLAFGLAQVVGLLTAVALAALLAQTTMGLHLLMALRSHTAASAEKER